MQVRENDTERPRIQARRHRRDPINRAGNSIFFRCFEAESWLRARQPAPHGGVKRQAQACVCTAMTGL